MEEQHDNLQPETIDHVTDGGKLSLPDHQTTRLIQHLHQGSQAYARENERSLERIWSRLAQSQEYTTFLQAERQRPEGKVIDIKERKSMQNNNTSWEMNPPPTSLPQPKKPRPFWRVMGIGLVAAVAIITIVSFTLFSGILRPAALTANNGSSTSVGAVGQQQQPQGISSGKQVCSFASELVSTNGALFAPEPVWSSQGQIAVAAYSSFKVFSANNCSAVFSKPLQETFEPNWSPDGKKVVVADAGDKSLYVLDNHGNTVAHWPFSQLGSFSDMIWSSDSSKLIYDTEASNKNQQESVKSIDINGHGSPTTIMTLPAPGAVVLFSPNGKYLLLEHLDKEAMRKDLEIWNVNSGNEVSTIPFNQASLLGWAFSPDGSLLALGGSSQTQIYTTADGKLQSSFSSSNAPRGLDLSWSPDGKYLAEGTTAINIYDVNAKKDVATFGQVDAHHAVFKLAWSPDSKGLVSSAGTIDDSNLPEATVSIWKLS